MVSWRVGLSFAVVVACSTPTLASAGDDSRVIRRLTKHGKLSNSAARAVSGKVGKRMAKSADNFAPKNDPLRVAVSQRLFGAPTPPDPMAGAKIRLRLFSGLNAWALETLFNPTGGQITNCQQAFGLSNKQCTALVAAAGAISVADARRLGGGQSAPVMARRPMPQQQQRFAPRPQQQKKSRFGSYNSGFSQNRAAPQRQVAVVPRQPVRQQSRFGGARPAPQRQMAPARRPAVNQGAQQSTAAAYKARRAARMARLQEEKAKKKAAKSAVGSSPAKAPVAKAPGGKPAKAAPAAVEEAPVEEGPPPAGQLDEGFLDGLLDDPLGKN